MQLDCEITAARQRASRLAGLVLLPAGWPIQTAIRRQASWLAPPNPLADELPKSAKQQIVTQPARGKPTYHLLRWKQKPRKG